MADSTSPPDAPGSPKSPAEQAIRDCLSRYWRSNLKIMLVLLTIWFVAGAVLGILLADVLSPIRIGGFPLGFWFAQQGSIVTFVVLILIYSILMNRLDKRHHDEITRIKREGL